MDDKKSISIKAILIGWMIDTLGTFITGVFIGIIIGFIIGFLSGMSHANPRGGGDPLDMTRVMQSNPIMVLQNMIGFFWTVLGGFVTAHIAKEAEYKNALYMGILSLVTGMFCIGTGLLFKYFAQVQTTNLMIYIIYIGSLVLTIPASLLGAYLRVEFKKSA